MIANSTVDTKIDFYDFPKSLSMEKKEGGSNKSKLHLTALVSKSFQFARGQM